MVYSGAGVSVTVFFCFFPALVPLFLPFPLPFVASDGLPPVALPINLNGLMGGAISETWPVGIRSGCSLGLIVSAGIATNGIKGSTRTSWYLGTVGPSRKDLI